MSDNQVNISVGADLIRPLINSKIQAAIAQSLAGSDEIVASAIRIILNTKVGGDGKPTSYSSSHTLLQWLCNDAIQTAAKNALKEWCDTQKPQITKALLAELKTKSRTDALVRAFTDGLTSSFSSGYRFKVEITPDKG